MNQSILSLVVFLLAGFASAATHEVKMLNNGAGNAGIMVFQPAYLKANPGDTIKFVPTDPAHDVSSVSIPKGAKAFQGDVGKAVSVTLKDEGVYLYECKSHLPMAMIGVIQVGKPVNLEQVKKDGHELAKKFVMQKERLEQYLGQVK